MTREERSLRHIRVVAVAGLVFAVLMGMAGTTPAAAVCSNEAARVGPSAALPDCRAYELVTPADKSSAVQDLDVTSSEAIPAVNGERLALRSLVAFGPRPMPNGSFSVFYRTSTGWEPESIPPLAAGSAFYEGPIFNSDLTEVGVDSFTTTPLSPDQIFQIGLPGGPYGASIATTPTNYERARHGEAEDFLAGAAPDFSHVFFESTDHTLLGSSTGTDEGARDLYEWASGELRRLVNAQSAGSFESPCGAKFDAVSEDGSKVVFTSPDPEARRSEPVCEQQPAQLYERVSGSSTVEVTKANAGVVDPTGAHPVQFEGASADGSTVFFTTTTELTRDDEGRHDEELYEYNANAREGEQLTRISKGTTESAGAEVNKIYVHVSKDGSEVYFYVKVAQELNYIYRYNTEAATGNLHLVATVEVPFLEPAGTGGTPNPGSPEEDQVTPNGRFLVFASKGVAGSGENNPARGGEGKYNEIFRYDDETESVTCVSCPLHGRASQGGASLTGMMFLTHDETPPITSVSEDGSYVFFQSNDELVPQDVNGVGNNTGSTTALSPWTDVYEWHNGVISLISSGTDAQSAILVGASADGSNVFFMTHAQLVPQDTDSSADIYDARINGGLVEAAPPSVCLGDTCLSTSAAPNDPTPATSSLPGPDNSVPLLGAPPRMGAKQKAKKCGKGAVRRKGRCVKQRRARKAARHDRGGSR